MFEEKRSGSQYIESQTKQQKEVKTIKPTKTNHLFSHSWYLLQPETSGNLLFTANGLIQSLLVYQDLKKDN